MEQEWRDLLHEFGGKKPTNVLLNMIVAILWYIIMILLEKKILSKSDAIKMRQNIREVALEAYKDIT